MIETFWDKYRTVCNEILDLKENHRIDPFVLERYSRLLKMKEWVDSEADLRYFTLEGGRLILADKLHIREGDIVLDVGSGDGWFSIQAGLKFRGSTFYGVELSEEFAEAMEYAKIFELKNVYFYYFDAYNLPFPDNTFEKIALFFSLANISFTREELEKLFLELRRVLSIGGLIGISEPFLEDFPSDLGRLLRQLYINSRSKDETILCLSDVERALDRVGLEIVDLVKIELKSTGVCIDDARKYLERYYEASVPEDIIARINMDMVWVRDDPPRYTIIIARKNK